MKHKLTTAPIIPDRFVVSCPAGALKIQSLIIETACDSVLTIGVNHKKAQSLAEMLRLKLADYKRQQQLRNFATVMFVAIRNLFVILSTAQNYLF